MKNNVISRLKHDEVSYLGIVPLPSEMVEEQSVSLVDLDKDVKPIERGHSTQLEKLSNHESNDDCSSSCSSSNSSTSMGWFFDNEKVEKQKDLKESERTKDDICSPTSPTLKKSIEGIGKKVRTRLVEIKKNRREVRRINTSTILAENLLLEKQSISLRKGVTNEGDDRKQGRGMFLNPMIKKNASRTTKGNRKRKQNVEKYHLNDDDKDTIVVDDWIPGTSHLPSVRSCTEDDNDIIDEELLREEFSNTVQLHGLPINTTSNHIRRLFTGLEPLKIVVLPTNPINIVELDSIHCFDNMEDVGHEHDQNPKLQRYASHTRIFVEFDSPSTTSLALQRSGEYIQITKETQKEAAKSSPIDDKTLRKSNKKPKVNSLKSNNDSHERTLTGHDNGSITKSGLELLSDCLLDDAIPSRTTKIFHVAVTVAPLCRKTYEVLAKNLFIPVDGPNNVPILEVFLRQLEMKIDQIILSILWTATNYELNITTPKVCSKKIARHQVQNQCDDDTVLGQREHSQSLTFPLYGKSNTYRIGRNMMKTKEEYDQLEQHCAYIQETVKCIQGKNPYVILIGFDPTIAHKDPIACLTARAIQCLKKAQDVIRQILLIAKRLHCQYFDNDRDRMKLLFRNFRFVRADVSDNTNLEM